MKRGISLVSLVIVIIVMGILAGIVVISGLDSTESVTLDTFALEILDIQNAVDEYYYRYEKYPSGSDYVLDTTTLKSVSQFSEETITDNTINFKVVDLSLIGIADTEFGSGNGNDIYVLSETTGIVYYLAGVTYENNTYYTLTEELYDITSTNNSSFVSANDIKVYNVIFTPSTTEYTNRPVTVAIKVPKIATIDSITTTNDKSVSEATVEGLYKRININETSTDKTGNYKITVNYMYRGVQKTSEYEVVNYDANLPSITYTETINGDLKTVKVTINNNGSVIKTLKYEQEIISQKIYFENYGKKLVNNQFVMDKDGYFTIYVETEAGTSVMVNNMPEAWKSNVTDIVDGVPIPKGFVASPYNGENTKSGGLVIYELNENEIYIPSDETQFESWTERNQYVWIPVDKENFVTEFVRNVYKGKTISDYSNIGTTDKYWEIEVNEYNMPKSKIELSDYTTDLDLDYITEETLLEVQEMYASVKEYGGFYVARYEAGINEGIKAVQVITGKNNVHSKMNKFAYTCIYWSASPVMNNSATGAVTISRSIYPNASNNTSGVISTLIYGVQWDVILNWWLKTGAVESLTDCKGYGNYLDHVISSADELNEGAFVWNRNLDDNYISKTNSKITYPKSESTSWALSTGALKAAKINNIYDMAGNMFEWTMEGYSTDRHTANGGDFAYNGNTFPVNYKIQYMPTVTDIPIGFRVSLYIKI